MREIRGQAKNIRALLQNERFGIDYFQREYQWGREQVSAALDDLVAAFRKHHEHQDGSQDAADRNQYYFLGSIVISESAGRRLIADGQQRITTVTLLLIALHHRLPEGDQRTALRQLIYSYRSGRTSFNLDVEDRRQCLWGLFHNGTFEDDDGKSASAMRMVENYGLIEEELNEAIDDSVPRPDGDDPLPLASFVDWLIESVYFIEVAASSDADAYAIFETLNDRGLPLRPAELLKSFLLSKIDAGSTRHEMNEIWKDRVAGLRKRLNWEGADADFIKTWLRSQYMESESDRDSINRQFHRWVGANTERLKLHGSDDCRRFIERDFRFYARWYEQVQHAARNWTEGYEAIYRNECAGLRDRNNLYLASLAPTDDDSTVRRKIRTVAAFIEILVARLSWKAFAYQFRAMYSAMRGVAVKIRRRPVHEMVGVFERANAEDWWFVDRFQEPSGSCGWPGNRRRTHRLLARMTEYIEVQAGGPSRYQNFVRTGRAGYDVEHIWAKHWKKRFEEPYRQETDFNRDRNRLGGLVLLPSSVNRAIGDNKFADKRDDYEETTSLSNEESPRNLLARSLVTLVPPGAESGFPLFGDFVEKSGLPFLAYDDFRTPAHLEAREHFYRELARAIWSMDAIREAAKASSETE